MTAPDDLPAAQTVDPLPRTVFAWQRTLLVIAANCVVLSIALMRQGVGLWGLPVLALAAVPIPAAARRQRALLAGRPAPVKTSTVALLTGVVVCLSCCGGLVALLA